MIAAQLLLRSSGINKQLVFRKLKKEEEKINKKKEDIFNLKERLQLMYMVGINHMASHSVRQVNKIAQPSELE